VFYLDNPSIKILFDKESINLHVLASVMLDKIVCNTDCRLVITPHVPAVIIEQL
jgi:hypothetical protein